MINEKYATYFNNVDNARAFAERVLNEGCAVLPDFFDRETHEQLLNYSRRLTDTQRHSMTWRPKTAPMNVARSAEFMTFFDAIHKARCEIENKPYKPLDPMQQCISLPVKTAAEHREETPFHYDGSNLNAVYVFKMPTNQREGNLLIYPNFRSRIKPLFLAKVLSRLLRHFPLLRRIYKPKEVFYSENALHVFFGDVTLHGVPPISAGERLTFTVNSHVGAIPANEIREPFSEPELAIG